MSTLSPRPPVAAVAQRRSQRIVLSVPLLITGKRPKSPPVAERASTVVVNAHGALILLKESVLVGQVLLLKNLITMEEILCTVVDVSMGTHGEPEVGVEFAEQCPRFWRVSFPPTDWSPRSAEAKQLVINKKSIPADAPTAPPLVKK